ncbi:hypothetical protein RB628_36035 [Streptomyces sp. ADMS]|uniref:hypothetical protein n=1 Tax=Streptomyces sp. ADMS TaxID=3071415 RepID=UPI00296F61A8|nr:hypothetical protein [Streptomyces sp. ADMS]MDW4910592.1 hypothetical protein [Streptomyces sp. ADMS]
MPIKKARSTASHRSTSRRKRMLLFGLAGVTVAGAATVPVAYGALAPAPPSSIVDLSTSETFDTGKLMGTLCPAPRSRDFFSDVTFWILDPVGGGVAEDPSKGVGDLGSVGVDGELHFFQGHCEWPVTDVKDDVGPAQVVSRPLINCGDAVLLRETVSQNFSTSQTFTTSLSIGGGFDFAVIKDVLSLSGNVSVTRSWAFGKEESFSRTVSIDVPKRTKGYFERVPVIRTVVSQPVFVIEKIARANRDGSSGMNGWKDTGSIRITSPAFRTESSADVLDANNFPSGTIRAQDDPVTPEDCD